MCREGFDANARQVALGRWLNLQMLGFISHLHPANVGYILILPYAARGAEAWDAHRPRDTARGVHDGSV